MNLLIVNDEQLTADTMKRDIPWEKYGISEVYTAYSAQNGRQCIEEHTVDILLCDIEMPGENGLSLLRWVRKERKDIECVFLTCHAEFAYAQEAISLGCQDYILIPARYEEIGAAIARVAERITKRREQIRYQEYGKHILDAQRSAEENASAAGIAEEVCAVILKNLEDKELSVDGLAEQFHFHPVYLNRAFKKETGVSVSQYIINERMKRAALLLEEGHFGANEVAEKVGYAHYTNFYNMFRKMYGCSPAKYQEEHLKKV